MTTTRVAHSSGRFNRKNSVVRRALNSLRNAEGVTVVTGTEAKHREDHALAAPDWELVHFHPKADSECWASYDPEVWEKAGKFRARNLSGGVFRRSRAYGGHMALPVTVLIVPLRHKATGRKVVFMVLHAMLDNTHHRAQIWVADAKVLTRKINRIRRANLRHGHHVDFVVNADWNKNFRRPSERAMIEKHIAKPAGLRQAWAAHTPKRGGTHGHALIDGTLTTLKVKAVRLFKRTKLQRRASDHNPYEVTVKL